MGWARSEAKRLSLLALLALAIQFGLCFGHTHLHAVWPSDHQTVTASSTSSSGGALPDDDELCQICRTAAMITSAAHAAVPPTLQIPVTFALIAFATEQLFESPESRLAAFRSRAPPCA